MTLPPFLRPLLIPIVLLSCCIALFSWQSSTQPYLFIAQTFDTTNGTAIGLEAGLCAQVKPDPVTGQKLVYCCLDEGLIYQREGSEEEYNAFVARLKNLEAMPTKDAKAIFDAPYDSRIHKKYDWQTLCGTQIPCDQCSQEQSCGNGVVETGEKCDDGSRNSDTTPDTCRSDCELPSCGDNVIDRQKGEKCDDGDSNANQPNRCRTDCALPACGDSIIDTINGETCDAGSQNSDTEPNRCRTNCQSPHCGDGVKDSNEGCDDGNRGGGDGCSFDCEVEQQKQVSSLPPAPSSVPTIQCGNGITEPGEECDGGTENANIPDHCRQSCTLPRCGDGIQDMGEDCDDGNTLQGDGCSSQCTRELVLSFTNICGNKIIDPGEECDTGSSNTNTPDHCRFDCRFPVCGDGIKDTGEQCDDHNLQNGDGCTQDCFSEFCGDGSKEMGEECDDGNLINGDGCDSRCQKDTGVAVTALHTTQSSSLTQQRSSARSSLRGAGTFSSSVGSILPAQQLPTQQSSTVAVPVTSAPSLPSSAPSYPLENTNPAPQVIPFPTAVSTQTPVSTSPQQQQVTYTTSALNDSGPATLSLVAMGTAAGLAWARRKRRD